MRLIKIQKKNGHVPHKTDKNHVLEKHALDEDSYNAHTFVWIEKEREKLS